MPPGGSLRHHLPAPALRRARQARQYLRAVAARGTEFECPVCHWRLRHFVPGPIGSSVLCPRCSSLERHRRMVLLLRRSTNLYSERLRVLHIAPEPSLGRELRRLANLDLVTGDLSGEGVDVTLDVTAIDYPDESFDVILCSHVLEHVPDDLKAMRELRRVLTRDGWALLNVPSDPESDEIYEDDSVDTPQGRLEHFGQEDHVRIYSVVGFVDRLEGSGWQVEVDPLDFSPYERARYALDGDAGWDHSYLCRRAADGTAT